MNRSSLPALAVVIALEALPGTARASEASTLFDDGVKLLDKGRYSEACPKLEQSQKLEPAAGTLLNLAACYEKSGRRTMALKTFREASKAAQTRGRADWQKIADDHARDLELALPKVTIARGATPTAVVVTLDGDAVDTGTPIPVDPGTHVVVAKSPGRRPFSSTVQVKESSFVQIPVLEPEGAPAAGDTPREDPAATRRTVGIVLVGVGAAGLVFGGVSGLVASGALSDAKDKCPSYPDKCAPGAQSYNDKAQTWSTISTISFIAGGAIAAGGAVLWFWPSPSVSVGTNGTTAFVRGTF